MLVTSATEKHILTLEKHYYKFEKTHCLHIMASHDFRQQKKAAFTSVSSRTLAREGTVRGIRNTVCTVQALVRRAWVTFRGTIRSGI